MDLLPQAPTSIQFRSGNHRQWRVEPGQDKAVYVCLLKVTKHLCVYNMFGVTDLLAASRPACTAVAGLLQV